MINYIEKIEKEIESVINECFLRSIYKKNMDRFLLDNDICDVRNPKMTIS